MDSTAFHVSNYGCCSFVKRKLQHTSPSLEGCVPGRSSSYLWVLKIQVIYVVIVTYLRFLIFL